MPETNAEQPGRLHWSLVEPVWDSLNESWDEGFDEFVRRLRKVPPRVGHIYAAHWCQSEVCNGGLYQFFSNTTGLLAPEAREAFAAIGLREWNEVLSQAMSFFGSPYPRNRARRQAALPTWPRGERQKFDPFWELDDRFYSWLRAGPDCWALAADRYARDESTRSAT